MESRPFCPLFVDRRDAGRRLGERLLARHIKDPVVIALPRGGVPVAFEVARALQASLDVLVVRKISAPSQPEYGIGAITETGYTWINEQAATDAGLTSGAVERIRHERESEVDQLVRRYRQGRVLSNLRDRTAILVDDGLATGVTAVAACHSLRALGPKAILLAVPVGPPDSVRRLSFDADEVICLECPRGFSSVSVFYERFEQTPDQEVIDLLDRARKPAEEADAMNQEIRIAHRTGAWPREPLGGH